MKEPIALNKKYVLIIIAAGRSKRLGSPKQLLDFQGKNLLQHTIDTALESQIGPVLLVLGANYEKIKSNINLNSLKVCENKHWESGMASSIICGIETLTSWQPNAEAAILMVCDQPFINVYLLTQLVKKYEETGDAIVASSYNGIKGIPALFPKKHFHELLALKGDTGARNLINSYAASLQTIPFVQGSIDIDTPEDYQSLLK